MAVIIKRFISTLISVAIIICSLCVSSSAEDAFNPILRFVVASDIHIADSGSDQEEARLAKLFNTAYSYAENQIYNKVDGAFFVGDISDRGTSSSLDKFFNIVNSNARPETFCRAILGNHEFYTSSSGTVSRFLNSSGYSEADTDFVMGGYHFIMMCPQSGGSGYTSGQKSWLKKRLSEDAKEGSAKPIFVFQHHNVSGTVYGSEAWGISDISSTLAQYPQVVDFSGHSHYPINDPRSIWQGTFTAINDGTLSYYEMGIAGVTNSAIYPNDYMGGYGSSRNHRDAAQYLIVEIDRNSAIRIKGYDLISDTFIAEYNIPAVGNTSRFVYTSARKSASTPPAFDSSASIKLKGARTDAAVFEIPQASGTDVVQHYRFEVYDKLSNLVSKEYALSDTFYFPNPKTLRCTVDGLHAGTEYTVKCYAVNCWEKESTPLMLNFKTPSTPDSVSCYDSSVKPDIFSFIQCENGAAYNGVTGEVLSRDGNPITYTDSLTGRCSAQFSGKNSYKFNSFKNSYASMTNSVTFEYYGEFYETDFLEGSTYVDILSNQESGGCGLELSKDGMLEFYAHVGGKYIHPGAKVEFGKPVHIVGTFDGRYVKVFINGVLAAYESAGGTIAFPSNESAQFLCIGGDSASNGTSEARFTGKIVTANVYGKALTNYEIEQLYNQYNTFDFITDSGYSFDLQNRLLFGFDLTELTAQNIKNAFNNRNLSVEVGEKIGTGTKIVLKDSLNKIYDTAEVVIFGDVNGDSWYDGTDAVVVSMIANGMLSESQVGKAVRTAADCNHDGIINSNDVDILIQAGLLLAKIDQNKSVEELKTDSAYIQYLSLISQNPSESKPADTDKHNTIVIKIISFIVKVYSKFWSLIKHQ